MKINKLVLTLFVVLLLSILNYCFSQDLLTVKNSVKIKENTNVYIKGAVKGESGGKITNSGILKLTGNWTNNALPSFLAGNGELVFTSSTALQTIKGDETTEFNKFTIDKSSGNVSLDQDVSVTNTLRMTNGQLDLKNATLTLGSDASIVNETNDNRIKVGDIQNNTGIIQTTRPISNVTDLDPGNIGVSLTNNSNLGEITIVRGHQLQSGTGSFSGNTSIARYIELRNSSNELIDFELDGNNKINMTYWDAELNGHIESELEQYQWVKEGGGEWWTPLVGTVNATNNLSTPDNSPYSSYFEEPNWYSLNFYGKYTLGSTSNPLPVEWLYFIADWQDETCSTVHLKWETASETNADYYAIQRSVNTNWETIKTTGAAGFSTQNLEYTDCDETPPIDADMIYYRLKQVDYDGNFKYSDIDVVMRSEKAIDIISIFPNPADDVINLEIISTKNTQIYMYVLDKLGKTVVLQQAEIVKGTNKFSLNISHLAPAIYTVLVITESGHYKAQKEFVK
ncbi:MAG: T9SS type A sorting domain-containing protein [Bacteroidales bacterium]|nr:T9SS type A sorting domain-containing protein [Bacteroidales bacterium]